MDRKCSILILVLHLTTYLAADKACPYKPIDIVFVIDGSGSEGTINFRKQLQFISNFTEQFEIGQNQTRVALLTFSTIVHNQFYLNELTTETEVLNRINSTDYPNGETNTHAALSYVQYVTLNRFYGAERNVTKLVVVLTDGKSLEPDLLKTAAFNLKITPLVKVIAVGIGDDVDYQELLMIGSDSNHTFLVPSFDVLHTLQVELTDAACNACNSIFSDICFVLDSSGSEGADNFHKQLEFVQLVINEFSFDRGSHTRVCVITYSTRSNMEIGLNQYSSKESLISNVINIPYREGETMTHLGLYKAKSALQSGNANKIAIVLTDGRSTEPQSTAYASVALQRIGADVFVVGIGDNLDQKELNIIASDHDHVFRVNSFDGLDEIHNSLVSRLCNPLVQTTTTTSPTENPIVGTSTTSANIANNVSTTTKRTFTTTISDMFTPASRISTTTQESTKNISIPTVETTEFQTSITSNSWTIATSTSKRPAPIPDTSTLTPSTTTKHDSTSAHSIVTTSNIMDSTSHSDGLTTELVPTKLPVASATSVSTTVESSEMPSISIIETTTPGTIMVSKTSTSIINASITRTSALPIISATSHKQATMKSR